MKSYILILIVLMTGIIFSGCNNDEKESFAEPNLTQLDIRPSFSDVPTKASFKQFFSQGDEIGLFVRDSKDEPYGNPGFNNHNVKSTRNVSGWVQTPTVFLSNENATVYAYYPYMASFAGQITIEAASQIDYLHGTNSEGQPEVNNSNPTVHLTMKHVLSLVQFRMCKQNYPGAGLITKIEIANSNSCKNKRFFSKGNWNIFTMSILRLEGANDPLAFENNSGLYTLNTAFPSVEAAYFSALVIPTGQGTDAAGDIVFRFTIDSKVFSYNLPAGTFWKAGTKNTYTVILTGRGLIVGDVVIEDWKDGQTGRIILQ